MGFDSSIANIQRLRQFLFTALAFRHWHFSTASHVDSVDSSPMASENFPLWTSFESLLSQKHANLDGPASTVLNHFFFSGNLLQHIAHCTWLHHLQNILHGCYAWSCISTLSVWVFFFDQVCGINPIHNGHNNGYPSTPHPGVVFWQSRPF